MSARKGQKKDVVKPLRNLGELDDLEINKDKIEYMPQEPQFPPSQQETAQSPSQQPISPPPVQQPISPPPVQQPISPPPVQRLHQQQIAQKPYSPEVVDSIVSLIERMHPVERAVVGYKFFAPDTAVDNLKMDDIMDYLRRFNVPSDVLEIMKIWFEKSCKRR